MEELILILFVLIVILRRFETIDEKESSYVLEDLI